MKLLQLVNKFPYPPIDGGAIATLNLTRAFSALGHEVTVLAMNTSKHHYDLDQLPSGIKRLAHFHAIDVDNRVSGTGALIALLQNRSYHVSRFISAAFNDKLIELLHAEEYDLVQLEGLYLAPYVETIRAFSGARIAMRAHNVEHLIWERNAQRETSLLKKWYLGKLAKQLKDYELSRLGKYDFLVPISPADAEYFRKYEMETPIHVCPASYDEERVRPSGVADLTPTLFFLGSLDWAPNLEGLRWFLEHAWSRVSAQFPGLKFYIAGRNTPAELKQLNIPNVIVLGEVEDACSFMDGKQIMVVPLFAGSGMRVKIVEGMALGKTIVSTSIGAEGTGARDGRELFIADTADAFITCIGRCVNDQNLCKRTGEAARLFAQEHFSARATAKALIDFYSKELAAC
ncbi:MAG: glycosyltransferase family 4 protein [Bacteroidota bacterium]